MRLQTTTHVLVVYHHTREARSIQPWAMQGYGAQCGNNTIFLMDKSAFAKLLAHDSDGVAEPGEIRLAGDWVVSTWGFRKGGPDGQTTLVRGCDLFVFRDGLIVRKDAFRKTYGGR